MCGPQPGGDPWLGCGFLSPKKLFKPLVRKSAGKKTDASKQAGLLALQLLRPQPWASASPLTSSFDQRCSAPCRVRGT